MEGTWIISIEMGNDAMQDNLDVAFLLFDIAEKIEWDTDKGESGSLQDTNGNTVARWEFVHD